MRRMVSLPSSTTCARLLILTSVVLAASCSANSTLGQLAGRELAHGRKITASLPGLLEGEVGRSRQLPAALENLGLGLGNARRIPDALRGMASELARPTNGIERILYLWAHEWDRTADLRRGSR